MASLPYAGITEKMRRNIVEILIGLKEMKMKVRLTLINLSGLADKTATEEAFFGLEMDARNAIQAKQTMAASLSRPPVVI